MKKCALLLLLFCFLHEKSFAQDTLPHITVTKISNKVLIAWINPFESVTAINIQRSPDSLRNFRTIGSVLNVKAKNNGFVDAQSFDSLHYYRVFISFEGGNYIFSLSHKPSFDLLKTVEDIKEVPETKVFTDPKKIQALTTPKPVKNIFVPSKLVYTGKENNVIIALADAEKKKYSVRFFEADGTPLFEIKKIAEPYLILDKVNFMHAGLFNFEIYAGGVLVEKHVFYIPRDGQPMPELDREGHQLR